MAYQIVLSFIQFLIFLFVVYFYYVKYCFDDFILLFYFLIISHKCNFIIAIA